MFGRKWTLFRVFGFPISIDASWFLVAALVTWTLATQTFPRELPGYGTGAYWAMGIGGMLGLFGSIVLHELSHAMVARRRGIPMRGITLFLFGGVAEMTDEPPTAGSEFLMAIAGPAMSVLIAGVCYGLYSLGPSLGLGPTVREVLKDLGYLNALLVLFNLVPAFPLDGGRVLRSLLWKWKKNLRRATRITSRIGAGFGLLLMGLAIYAFLGGYFISAVWFFFIGMFLRNAANMSYSQLLARQILEGESVEHFMKRDVVCVPAEAGLQDLIENYVYRYHHKMFPVLEGDRLLGSVDMRRIKEIAPEERAGLKVRDVVEPCSPETCVAPGTDSVKVLATMNRTSRGRMLVAEDGRLEGVVTLKDILGFLSMKIELEGDSNHRGNAA